ncbi:hypothetical protein LNKW23_20420 [Paralimibaculum aggregatum]|uniref:Uncharacterized protein n=1 Tax=Paralimibaculum aggregatum TaxID=3036245 RepID=A0ABQ6LPY4_9RHOB|nr:hypothetical protein [Limibaculum sp. NKW23]GMG82829.1 hypothetical protein LNKW23_20420 [Limibaculum sp. NKW23]
MESFILTHKEWKTWRNKTDGGKSGLVKGVALGDALDKYHKTKKTAKDRLDALKKLEATLDRYVRGCRANKDAKAKAFGAKCKTKFDGMVATEVNGLNTLQDRISFLSSAPIVLESAFRKYFAEMNRLGTKIQAARDALKTIDRQLAGLDPASPQHAALKAKRDQVSDAVDKALKPSRYKPLVREFGKRADELSGAITYMREWGVYPSSAPNQLYFQNLEGYLLGVLKEPENINRNLAEVGKHFAKAMKDLKALG